MGLGFVVLVGLGLAALWFFVLFGAAMFGIPIESRKSREKRATLAAQLQQEAIEAEARRNLEVRAAEQRLMQQGEG